MRTKRELKTGEEIRAAISENGMEYILVPNKIFKLYKRGLHEVEINNGAIWGEEKEYEKMNFDSRYFALYIGLKFLDQMNFYGFKDEVAAFMNISERRLRERIKNIEKFKMPMNNEWDKHKDKFEIVKDRVRITQLVRKRGEIGFERNRKVKTDRWFCPWDCERKEVKSENGMELKPYDFFSVTVYDFDLFRNGILNDDEFVMYLYLVRSYNSNEIEKKGIAQSVSKIAENLNIKNPDIVHKRLKKLVNLRVKDKWCSENEDFPLLQTTKPKNYNVKLTTRQEPSLHYYPIYNDLTIGKINDKEDAPDNVLDIDNNKPDTNNHNSDSGFSSDTHLYNSDSKIDNSDTTNPF